jgi:hypothetical protein
VLVNPKRKYSEDEFEQNRILEEGQNKRFNKLLDEVNDLEKSREILCDSMSSVLKISKMIKDSEVITAKSSLLYSF